jgi:uncharacterized protein (DUF1697 family)
MMAVYIAMLRGINVAGKNSIKMESLRAMFESLGFSDVASYIQSGNVLFSADDLSIEAMEKLIAEKIEAEFGFSVPVLVRSLAELQKVLRENPFMDGRHDEEKLHVTFLSTEPKEIFLATLKRPENEASRCVTLGREVYLYCPDGYARTAFNNAYFEKKLFVGATTRSWKTVNKLCAMASASQQTPS